MLLGRRCGGGYGVGVAEEAAAALVAPVRPCADAVVLLGRCCGAGSGVGAVALVTAVRLCICPRKATLAAKKAVHPADGRHGIGMAHRARFRPAEWSV